MQNNKPILMAFLLSFIHFRSILLPVNMNTATISLLLKPNKDLTSPSSYRPISLINTNLKITSKALAHRLEKVICSIIHPDQTGFIKGICWYIVVFKKILTHPSKETITLIESLFRISDYSINWSKSSILLSKTTAGMWQPIHHLSSYAPE